MKKKIFLLLTVTLCIIGALGISSAAATAEDNAPATFKIKGAALILDNTVNIQYIAEYDGIDDYYDVKLLVWEEAQDEYVYGTQKHTVSYTGTTMKSGGVTYPYFEFTEAGAKRMTMDYYAVLYANTDDGEFYSKPVKYGILHYAYNKLGKTGTATTNAKLITLLESLLDYGAAAQDYLNFNTDRLANDDFYQVKVSGGLLSDGFNNGLFLEGETAHLSAPLLNAENLVFARWENSAGASVSTDREFDLSVGNKNDVYKAVYEPCSHPGEWTVTLDPTCTTEGSKEINCTVCGEHATAAIAPLDHDLGEWYTFAEPNCTYVGEKRSDCQREGCDYYETEDIAIVSDAHNYVNKVCSYCGKDEVFVPTVPVNPSTHTHTWGALTLTTAPTCTETGLKTATCTGCTATYTLTIPALGHSIGGYESVGESGHARACLREGCDYFESVVAHTGGSATCTEKAVCTDCGASYGSLAEHDFGEWTTSIEATCSSKGEIRRECEVCGTFETESLPIDTSAHNYIDGVCEHCGGREEDEGEAPGEGSFDTPLLPAT